MIPALMKTNFWASLWKNAAATSHPTQKIVNTPYGDVTVQFCYGSVSAVHEAFSYRGRVRTAVDDSEHVEVFWTETASNKYEPDIWNMASKIFDKEVAENVITILVLKYVPE
jgi:hypothetical protein